MIVLSKLHCFFWSPFKVSMHRESVIFENPIVACYFEGRAETDKEQKKLGLKQQSIGRQMDLIKNLTAGHIAELHKEKILLLVWEVLQAPYSYKPGKFWRIVNGGFIEFIKVIKHQERDIEKLIIKIWEMVNNFYSEHSITIKTIYDMDFKKYDLLSMLLFKLSEEKNKLVFSIGELIKYFIDEFEIKPSQPPLRIRHHILNQWINNIVSIKDYENDMSKRLLEFSTLKRMLIPKMGTVDMWILTPSKKNSDIVAQRQPCQMLSFNKDANLYITHLLQLRTKSAL